jgi:hypothetical protein
MVFDLDPTFGYQGSVLSIRDVPGGYGVDFLSNGFRCSIFIPTGGIRPSFAVVCPD